MIEFDIEGGKGGDKKPHTPVETPNNLISVARAKVLIAVAEGELAGTPTAKDIYLDGTPLENPDGSQNFGGVKWEWRSGAQVQDHIVGLPEVSTEFNVGQELTTLTPWTRLITNTNLDAARFTVSSQALLKQEENGDTNGVTVEFVAEIAVDGGPFTEYQKYKIEGKTNSGYQKTYRIDLPKTANNNWTLRVRRLTPDSQTGRVQDKLAIQSFAEVLDVKQTYPNTALLYVEFDSQLFGGGSIPRISVKTRGRYVRVPTNYDAESRTYTGIWNGDFKWSWSNNPIWVYYDIITNDRFGLGKRVTPQMVDKYTMYEVAQYCDVLVSKGDGSGAMEPRHTCNIYIQEERDAWTVLRDIAGIFNGMTYWNGNQFVAFADKEEDISDIPLFSRANVANGRFDYQSADEKSLYTSALVSYDDPANHYNTQVEATSEQSEILRLGGDRTVEISAIGCTSRGEAQRKGKYTLITNLYDRQVNFKTGLQGMDERVFPGKVIHVLDPLLGGRPFTGRVRVAADTVITLDRDVEAKAGDILYITKKNGATEGRTVASAQGNIVQVTVAFSELPQLNTVWYLEASDLKSQLFRVTKVKSPSDGVFEIDAVEYNESKYAAVDNGARLESRPISVVPAGMQEAPKNIKLTSYNYTEQTLSVSVLNIAWDQTPNAINYEIQWKVNDGDWVPAGQTGANNFEIKGIYAGRYAARIRAINAGGIKSVWAYSQSTQLNGKEGKPLSITSLIVTPLVFGQRLDWTFPQGAGDTLRTEIMYSETPSFANAKKLGDFSYPTDSHELHGLKAGQGFWYWARLVDRTGNVGDYFPVETGAGVYGVSSADAQQYNDYFAEMIGESALAKDVLDRIDLIDGAGPGSVNERLQELQNDVQAQIDAIPVVDLTPINNQIATINTDLTNLTNKQAQDVVNINKKVDDANLLINNQLTQLDTDVKAAEQNITTVNTTLTNQINTVAGDVTAVQNNVNTINTDLGNRITTVQNDLQDQINAIDFNNVLVYDNTKTYTAGQTTFATNGRLYQAKTNVPVNQPPPNTTYWIDIGQAVVTADGLATRVSKVETDVTNIDGRVTANANSITGLQTQVDGKADTSVVNALGSRVTTAEGKIDAQGSAITGLQTQVNDKADASALNSLTTRVTTAEGKIDSNAQAITNLTASVGNISGNGTNLLPAEYTVFTDAAPVVVNGSIAVATVADPTAFNGYVLRMNKSSGTGTVYFATGNTYATANLAVKNKKYIASWWAKSTGSNKAMAVSLRTIASDGTVRFSSSVSVNITNVMTRYSVVLDLTSALFTGDKMCFTMSPSNNPADGIPVDVDKVMLEEQVGTGVEPSAFTPGVSFGQVAANAQATQALNVRVTTAENKIDANASAITSLNSKVDGKADTSALNSLTTRVTTAEGKIDTQAQSITNLTTRVTTAEGKITTNTNAISSLTTTVTEQGGKITANTQSITNLTTRVDGKADTSALNSLGARVTTAEGKIDANSQSITNLSASIGNSNSENIVLNAEYKPEGVRITRSTATEKIDYINFDQAPAGAPQTIIYRHSKVGEYGGWGGNAAYLRNGDIYEPCVPGEVINLECQMFCETNLATNGGRIAITFWTPDGGSTIGGNKRVLTWNPSIGGWQKLSAQETAPAGSGRFHIYYVPNDGIPAVGSKMYVGNLKVTRQTGVEAATATAVQSLDARVTSAEGTITSQGNAITALTSRVDGKADTSALNALSTRVTTAEGKIDTQATSITNLTTRVTNAEGVNVAQGTAISNLETKTTQQGNSITANTQAITNLTTRVDGKADTTAVNALSARVTTAEGKIDANTTSITNLEATVKGVVTQNVIIDPSFAAGISSPGGAYTAVVVNREDAPNGAPSPRVVKWTAPATSGSNVYFSFTVNPNLKSAGTSRVQDLSVREGDVYDVDVYVYSSVGRQHGIWMQQYDSAGASIAHNWAVKNGENQPVSFNGGVWERLSGQWVVGAGCIRLAMTVRCSSGDLSDVYISEPTFKKRSVEVTANIQATQSLEGRVTSAEGTITSQGTAITSLTGRLTTAEGNITANGNAITSLQTTVTSQGNTITSQGNAITSLTSTVGNIGGNGTNLNPSQWSTFNSVAPSSSSISGGLSYKTVLDTSVPSNYALNVTITAGATSNNAMYLHTSNVATVNGSFPIGFTKGKYIVSFYAKADADRNLSVFMRNLRDDGSIASTPSFNNAITTTWQRFSGVIDMTSATWSGNRMVFCIMPNTEVKVGELYLDRIMVEKQIGTNTEPSSFVAGSADLEVSGLASALNSLTTRVTKNEGDITTNAQSITSLTGRVTTAEGKITSQGSAINSLETTVSSQGNAITSNSNALTTLNNSIQNLGGNGANLLPAEYCVFGQTLPALVDGGGITSYSHADPEAFNGYALRLLKSSGTGTTYLAPNNTYAGANIAFRRGYYIGSFYAKAIAGQTKDVQTSLRTINSAGAVVFGGSTTITISGSAWKRYSAVFDMTGSNFVGDKMAMTISASANPADGISVLFDRIMLEEKVGPSNEPSTFVIGDSFSSVNASASAVQALTTRVSNVEGTVSSQGQAITKLTNDLATTDGKANANATGLSSLTTRVTTAEGTITSQGNSITNLTNRVTTAEGKITTNTNAISSLGTTVTQQGQTIDSQGQSITNLSVDIANSVSDNLIANPKWLEGGVVNLVNDSSQISEIFDRSNSAVPSGCPSERVYRLMSKTAYAGWGGNGVFMNHKVGNNYQLWHPATGGDRLNISVWMYCKNGASPNGRIAITGTNESGVTGGFAGNQRVVAYDHAAGGWQRLTAQYTLPAGVGGFRVYIVTEGVPAGFEMFVADLEVTRTSAAELILADATQSLTTRVSNAEGNITSQGSAITNLTNSLNNKADVSAVNALTTRVSNVEGTVTSQGTSITNLNASLSAVQTANLLLDPTFSTNLTFSGNSLNPEILSRNAADVPAGSPSPRVAKLTYAQATGNTYIGFQSSLNVRPPENGTSNQIAVAGGEIYDFETYFYNTTTRQCGIWVQFYDASGSSVEHNWVTADGDGVATSTIANQWVKHTGSRVVPDTAIRMSMTFRVSSGSAATGYLSQPKVSKRDAKVNATASAVTSLDARVTTAEGAITSQASSLTQLNTKVDGKADSSVVSALSTRVSTAEGKIDTQGQAITRIDTSVNAIGGAGTNLNPAEYSVFNDTPPTIGGLSSGNTYTTVADTGTVNGYALRFRSGSTSTTLAAYFHMSNTTTVLGSLPISYEKGKYILSFYAKASVAGRQIAGYVRYMNSAGSVATSTKNIVTLTTAWTRYSVIVDATGAAWSGNRMAIGFDTNTSGISGTDVYFDRVMIEKQTGPGTDPSPFVTGNSFLTTSAQAVALNSMQTTITQQGGQITANATAVQGLQTRVGNSEAAIQNTQSALATTDGKVNAQQTLTTQVISGNGGGLRRVVAGISINATEVESSVLVFANKFAVVNSNDGSSSTVTVPFSVVGGQVFINEALITKAMIRNLIIGNDLVSETQTNWGPPVLQLSMGQGRLAIHHQTRAYTYTEIDHTGQKVYVDGVLRVRMGTW